MFGKSEHLFHQCGIPISTRLYLHTTTSVYDHNLTASAFVWPLSSFVQSTTMDDLNLHTQLYINCRFCQHFITLCAHFQLRYDFSLTVMPNRNIPIGVGSRVGVREIKISFV